MNLEIRQATPEEMDDFRKVSGDALMIPVSDSPFSKFSDHTLTLCAFVNGKLATSYAAWNLTTLINGGSVPMAGVTMVGTNPVYRRLGCLRKITASHFTTLFEEKKQPISGLYASQPPIYRRYGYSSVVRNCAYSVEPRYLEFIAGKVPSGSFREAGESDIPVFSQLYDAFIADRTGYLTRNEEAWKRKFNPSLQGGTRFFPVIYEEDGSPQACFFYFVSSQGPGAGHGLNINVSDVTWHTPSAYRAVWEFFSRMDLGDKVSWRMAPEDDPLHHLVIDPRRLNKTMSDGLYGRIVDVEQAMDKRGYDTEGTLTFKLVDDFCPWNEGTWKLEASPEGSSITKTGEAPQIEMPVSTLALLYFNLINTTLAYRMGRLDVNNMDSLETWDKVMKTKYPPACADGF